MRCLVLGALGVALVGSFGCSSNDSPSGSGGGGGGGSPPDVSDVVFVGKATAPELQALLPATASTKAKPMPTFVTPGPVTEYVAGDDPPKFSWNDVGEGPSGTTERTFLQFGAPGQAELLRLFTSESEFTPSAEQWKTLSVGTWVTVDIYGGAYDAHDALVGAPAEGEPIQFCSMPPRK